MLLPPTPGLFGYTRDILPSEPMPIAWQDQPLFGTDVASTDHAFIDINLGADGELNPANAKLFVFADTVGNFTAGKLAVHKYTSEGDKITIQIIEYTEFNTAPNQRVLITDYTGESQFLAFKIEILENFVIPT